MTVLRLPLPEPALVQIGLSQNGAEGATGDLFAAGGDDHGQYDAGARLAVLDMAAALGDKYEALTL